MSQPETVTQMPQKKTVQLAQSFISGRIHSVRKIDTKQGSLFLTVLKLAAADEYSHPSTIEVRSNTRLGKVADDWKGLLSISGMPNNYEKTDKQTGETEMVHSARNELTVVEE